MKSALRLAARLFDKPLIENQYRSAFIEAMIDNWSFKNQTLAAPITLSELGAILPTRDMSDTPTII
jgi:hypothetical protein